MALIREAFSSLRSRLLFLVLLAGVPSVGLMLVTAYEQRQSAEALVERDALRLVRQAAATQERWIEDGRQLLLGLSRLPVLRAREPEACRELLSNVLQEAPQYFNISVAEPNGDTRCSALPIITANIADRPFFQEVVRTRAFVVSDYVLGRATGRPNVTLSHPMFDDEAQLSGVLVVGFELTWMSDLMRDAGLPAGASFTVVDRQDTVILRYPAGADWIGKPLPDTMPSPRFQDDVSEDIRYGPDNDGVESVYAITTLRGTGHEAFGVAAVAVPRSTAFAEADRQLTRNLIGLMLAALGAMVAAWVGGDILMLRGIRRQVHLTQRLASGDFTVRSGSAHGMDEVALLARAFDQLADTLARHEVERDRSEAQLRASAEREHAARLQEASARQAAEQAEHRFRTFVESAPDAIVIINMDGEIVVANGQASVLFGYASEELLGQSIEMLLPEQLRMFRRDHRVGFSLNSQTLQMGNGQDLFARRKDGTEVPIEVSLGQLETDSGVLIASVIRDISERRAVERLKEQFVSTVSHELRTPLTPIIGIAGLLLRTNLTASQKRLVETVERAGQSLLRIVNDILDFSKLEAGELVVESVDLDLRETVEDVIQLAGERARAKGLNLVWHVADAVPPVVLGDPVRLRQVIGNLIDNAVKFTADGEIVVWGHLVEEIDDAVVVRFEVVDTGIGISAEAMSRLFQPFSQADPSITRTFGGTGLGLAICAQLVAKMGGEIGVESTLGTGSTLWFTVRLGKPATAKVVAPEIRSLDHTRILIVDDSAANRLIYQSQMSAWGADVDVATDASDAMRMLRAAHTEGRPFNIAVLDLHLEGIDGVALARLISQDVALAPTRLVMLASDHPIGVQHEATAAGVSAILMKPIRRNRLLETLLSSTGAVPPEGGFNHSPAGPTGTPKQWSTPTLARRGRILVVEDSAMNQVVILGMLDQLGYNAEAVDDGQGALDALAAGNYDAVLMDGQMPGMDGITATAEIRQSEKPGTHIPIIAMTASAMPGDRERFLQAGMDDYLTKPISIHDFEATLTRWVPTLPQTPAAAGHLAVIAVPPTPAWDAVELLDTRILSSLRQTVSPDGNGLDTEVAALFVAEAQKSLGQLRAAIASGDLPVVRTAAHRLSGTSASVGACQMHQIASALEDSAIGGDQAAFTALIELLTETFERTKHAVHEFLTPVSSGSARGEAADEGRGA